MGHGQEVNEAVVVVKPFDFCSFSSLVLGQEIALFNI